MEDVKVGNIVKLKSGGNPMTISEVLVDGTVKCIWNVGEAKGFLLHPAALEVVDISESKKEEFEIGDRVYLNSGGTIMTVIKKISDDIYVCAWNDKVSSGYHSYSQNVLVRETPPTFEFV